MEAWRLFACLLLAVVTGAQERPVNRIEHLKEAARLVEKQRYEAAEETLAPLLRLDRSDPLALNLLGLVRLRRGRMAEAASLFEQAIQSGRPVIGPHINLARIYGTDRAEEALLELGEALKIAPGNEPARGLVRQIAHDRALSYVQQGKRAEALALLGSAKVLLPADPNLLYEYGVTSLESGNSRDAVEALTSALHLKTYFPDASYALARAELADNQPQAAEAHMRQYLKAKPNDATGQYGLGYVLVAEQKLDEAKTAFEKSLELDSGQTESLFQLGEIDSEQSDNMGAKARFDEVLKRDPKHAGALTAVGILAYRAGRYGEAEDLLEHAIAAAPDFQKAHYFHALTLIKLGDTEGATKEFAIERSLQKAHAQ